MRNGHYFFVQWKTPQDIKDKFRPADFLSKIGWYLILREISLIIAVAYRFQAACIKVCRYARRIRQNKSARITYRLSPIRKDKHPLTETRPVRVFYFMRFVIESCSSQICDGINHNAPDRQVLNQPPRVVNTAIPDYPCCCFYPQTGRIARTPGEICNFKSFTADDPASAVHY